MYNKEDNNGEICESKTKYGEMIPSTFSWLPVEEQKKRAEQLNKMTKKKAKN